ncbi:hypothetical protein GCM10011506_43280 [Marivirga lumbricoides]|uniref:Uncharacterized protein n=1 Tax=Marivirga lumbricoides TaxID=1046115 RepID=A0A2T4DVC9_9BACT|nr:hypothetical protein C9994_01515 [Marivirga lumbricoides]GGC52979.1 hypothetical protein GCM10011506_43280 [Marivirga lumbricoides]
MKKSKVFLIIAAVFMAIVFYVIYDMASKTTFPGGNKKKEQTKSTQDSIYKDTMQVEIKRDEPNRKKD